MLDDCRRYEMRGFFDLLSDFEVDIDEEIELSSIPYPQNLEPEAVIIPLRMRCASVSEAYRIAVPTLGSNCELNIAIVTRDRNKTPNPEDTKQILGSWQLRERTSEEIDLEEVVWRLQGSPSHELQLTQLYPSGSHHVCQATIYFDRRRYRGPADLDIFEVLHDRMDPLLGG